MKYQKILQQIIEEEIEKACLDLGNGIFFEQAAPVAADPNAAGAAPPVADPNAASAAPSPDADSAPEEPTEEKDDVGETIKNLGKKTATDIKKTIISDIQTGDREKSEKIIARVEAEKDKSELPKDVKQAVTSIQRVFKFKVPEEIKDEAEKKVKKKEEEKKEKKENKEQQPAAGETSSPSAAAPQAPVVESKLQITLREYLFYKKQYEKRGNK